MLFYNCCQCNQYGKEQNMIRHLNWKGLTLWLDAFPVPRPYCCFDRTVCDVAPCGKAEAWNFILSVEIQLFFSSRLLNMLASKAVSRSLRQLALAGKTFGVSHIATFSPCRCTSYLDDFFLSLLPRSPTSASILLLFTQCLLPPGTRNCAYF